MKSVYNETIQSWCRRTSTLPESTNMNKVIIAHIEEYVNQFNCSVATITLNDIMVFNEIYKEHPYIPHDAQVGIVPHSYVYMPGEYFEMEQGVWRPICRSLIEYQVYLKYLNEIDSDEEGFRRFCAENCIMYTLYGNKLMTDLYTYIKANVESINDQSILSMFNKMIALGGYTTRLITAGTLLNLYKENMITPDILGPGMYIKREDGSFRLVPARMRDLCTYLEYLEKGEVAE